MTHFGLSPAPLFAVLVILLELGASLMILTIKDNARLLPARGRYRHSSKSIAG
jgi:hypothetical protein